MSKLHKWINKKEGCINHELFKKYFNFQRPSDMLKAVYTANDKKEINDSVNLIKSGLSDL